MQQQSAEPLFSSLDSQPKGAARIGGELRAVRERLGWRLADVADGLRIRLPYLEAIERGELSALPGPAYQTGFVRTYAQALGLDPEEILRRFRAEGLGVPTKAELSFLAPVPDRAVPTGAIVLLGVVLLLVGYGLWFRHTETERRLAAAVPSVPAELAPLAMPKPVPPPVLKPAASKPAAPQAAAPQLASNAPAKITPVAPATSGGATSVVPGAVAPAAAAPATAPPPVSVSPPAAMASVQSIPPPPAAASMLPSVSAPAGQASADPAAPAVDRVTPPTGQTIVATADSWVEVKDPTGNILFDRTLHAGESWPVPDVAGLTMTAGNAGATEITTGGKASAPLGAAGAVVRNYALTPPVKTN
jgi:cytoskeleton protein RodZ